MSIFDYEAHEDSATLTIGDDHPLYAAIAALADGEKEMGRTIKLVTKKVSPDEKRRRRLARTAVKREAAKLIKYTGEDHDRIMTLLCIDAEVDQDDLIDALDTAGYPEPWTKLRGVLGGLSKICKRRGVKYPIMKSTRVDADGETVMVYSLAPYYAKVLNELLDIEVELD